MLKFAITSVISVVQAIKSRSVISLSSQLEASLLKSLEARVQQKVIPLDFSLELFAL